MKVDTQIIQTVLKQHKLDPLTARSIFDDIRRQAEAEASPRTKSPKKPFLIVVSDPTGVIPAGTELVGWAIQIDPEKDMTSVPASMQRVAQDFNASKKGEKLPAKSIGDMFESATGKQFVAHGMYRKHKEPVLMVVTDNKVIVDEPAKDPGGEVVFSDSDDKEDDEVAPWPNLT